MSVRAMPPVPLERRHKAFADAVASFAAAASSGRITGCALAGGVDVAGLPRKDSGGSRPSLGAAGGAATVHVQAASAHGMSATAPPPDLSDEPYGRILYVHMLALACVLEPAAARVGPQQLAGTVLRHEFAAWPTDAGADAGADADAVALVVSRARRIVAALTLVGPASYAATVRLVQAVVEVNEPVDPAVARWCRTLGDRYRPGAALPARGAPPTHVGGLQPGLLGEELVAEELTQQQRQQQQQQQQQPQHHCTPADLMGLVDATDGEQVRNALAVLDRVAADIAGARRAAESAVLSLLARCSAARAGDAVLATLAGSNPAARGVVAPMLLSWLASLPTGEHAILADAVWPLIPESSASLADVRLWCAERRAERVCWGAGGTSAWSALWQLVPWPVVAAARALAADATLAREASALSALQSARWCVGQREAALLAGNEAVDVYRMLAARNPNAFEPGLADALSCMSMRLVAVGRREALEAARDAVALYRKLAGRRSDAFDLKLASTLNIEGKIMGALGRPAEAVTATCESVALCRKLVTSAPGACDVELAAAQNNLGVWLNAAGQREAALAATREAVILYRKLANRWPNVFVPELAGSLDNVASDLSALDRREEALEATLEAVTLWRTVVTRKPGAFNGELAGSLNNLGASLNAVGRCDEGVGAVREAVTLARELVARNPESFLPTLATCIHTLGTMLSALGQRDGALASAKEAVALFRQLAACNPGAFEPDLATSLGALGNALRDLGQDQEAAEVAHEATVLRGKMAAHRPTALRAFE
jgi:tetratricopeptide (TPR) repeat protein